MIKVKDLNCTKSTEELREEIREIFLSPDWKGIKSPTSTDLLELHINLSHRMDNLAIQIEELKEIIQAKEKL